MQTTITITRKRYDELIRKEFVFDVLKGINDEASYPDKHEARMFNAAVEEKEEPKPAPAAENDDF